MECTVSDVTVKGGNNGSIKVKGVGGVAPYTITCNNKTDFKNLKAGNYDIRLSDKNNCTVIETVIISEPE
jgi:hypothetical protein